MTKWDVSTLEERVLHSYSGHRCIMPVHHHGENLNQWWVCIVQLTYLSPLNIAVEERHAPTWNIFISKSWVLSLLHNYGAYLSVGQILTWDGYLMVSTLLRPIATDSSITGAESLLSSLLTRLEFDLSMSTSSLQCLKLDPNLRKRAAEVLLPPSKLKDILYVMLVAEGKVITLIRPKKHSIHPAGKKMLSDRGYWYELLQIFTLPSTQFTRPR